MDPLDFFFMEEFLFPEEGGVTGTRTVPCPVCGAQFELEVDVGNTADVYHCSVCDTLFSVNWPEETVTAIGEDRLDDNNFSDEPSAD